MAHLSLTGPHAGHNTRSDLAAVPVTGLGPIVMAPAWSESREDPMIHAFVKIASRLGRQRGWDRVLSPD